MNYSILNVALHTFTGLFSLTLYVLHFTVMCIVDIYYSKSPAYEFENVNINMPPPPTHILVYIHMSPAVVQSIG